MSQVGSSEGYFVEHNGDTFQSVFPSAEAAKSQLHTTVPDAINYMVEECGIDRNKIKVIDPKQKALATIEGLEISDVLKFFYEQATPRDKQIAEMVETDDDLEVDGAITSEGDDNGSWVLSWTWVSFADTAFDRDKEEEDEQANETA